MANKKWSKEDIDWLITNYNNVNLNKKDFEDKLNIDWNNICKRASKLKLKRPFKSDSKLFRLNNIICEEYKKGINIPRLANKYFCSKDSIREILIKNNIERRDAFENKRTYSYDKNYFEKIDTPDKAYFLGFLYADGNVFVPTGSVKMALQARDSYILEIFKKYICYQGDLKIIEKQNMVLFQITSKKLVEQLIKLGCIPKKSLVLKFPTEEQVPEHLLHHFIRGFFDGDGHITISKKISMGFTSTKEFLTGVQNILVKNCNINYTKIHNKTLDKNTYALCVSGFFALQRIYNYLYENKKDIFLTRKEEKFNKFKPQRKERCTSDKYKNKC